MALKEEKYLWAVTIVNLNDGHRTREAVFTNRLEAEDYATKFTVGQDARVVQTTLHQDTVSGKYFEVEMREVPVDEVVLRRSALAKLTQEERRVLGL